MYETSIHRKWARWNWTVSDSAGNIVASGREVSRAEARYKCASALFQILLWSSVGDFEKLKRDQHR